MHKFLITQLFRNGGNPVRVRMRFLDGDLFITRLVSASSSGIVTGDNPKTTVVCTPWHQVESISLDPIPFTK